MEEENPFTDPQVAKEWIESVEGEKGLFRDILIYPTLESWAKELGPAKVLEIGSGQGACSEHVGELISYIGLEPSKILVERAEELYGNKGRKFVVGDAYAIPFDDEVFDASFSVNVLFHLGNLKSAFSELSRVIKTGGKFLIITANPKSYKDWISFYDDPIIEGNKVTGKVNVPVRPMSKNIFYQHTKDEIEGVLSLAGLKLEKIYELFEERGSSSLFVALKGSK